MNYIHPGTYVEFGATLPEIVESAGTIGFFPFISERYKDCELIFTGNLNLEIFGAPNKAKFTQGLYNARNFHEVSTWAYVMRILPVVDNVPVVQYDDNGNCISNCEYLHPLAGQDVTYVDADATNTVHIPDHKIKPVPTFAHAAVGYVVQNDDDGNPVKVGGFVRYYNPLYKIPQNKENLLYLDEQPGDITRTLAKVVLTNELDLRYNPTRQIFTDNCHVLVTDSLWSDVIVGGDGNGGINDSANGFTDKYWPGFSTSGSYYYQFSPAADSFHGLIGIFGIGRGPWYNDIRISLIPTGKPNKTYYFQTLYHDPLTGTMVTVEPQYEVSFDPEGVDEFDESNYVGYVINTLSKHVNVHLNGADVEFARLNQAPGSDVTILEQVLSWTYEYDPAVDLQPKTRQFIELREGSWGCLYKDNNTLDPILVNASFKDALSGAFDEDVVNPFKNDISVAFDVDYTPQVKESLQTMVNTRQDSFAYLDIPKSASPDAAIAKRHAELSAITSWQCGLFGVHSLVESTFEGKDIWVAPTYHLSKLVPTVDKTGELWDAVAGLKRAVISAKKLQYSLNSTSYDRWYLAQLNPVLEKMGVKHIAGNLTAQIVTGPKSNINIVRMELFVSKTLRKFGENYIFDSITPATLSGIQSEVNAFLASIKQRNGITGFSVLVSSTPYEMKRKIVRVNVSMTPVYALEKLIISVNLTQ